LPGDTLAARGRSQSPMLVALQELREQLKLEMLLCTLLHFGAATFYGPTRPCEELPRQFALATRAVNRGHSAYRLPGTLITRSTLWV
jgi:hypothetical protein